MWAYRLVFPLELLATEVIHDRFMANAKSEYKASKEFTNPRDFLEQ